MSCDSYSLHYFVVRGRGELIRLLLVQAGVKFEDKRFTMEDWPQAKAVGNYPYGQLPVLFVDNKPLAQSLAISRYLANKFGLNAECCWGKALCDQVVDSIGDLRDKMSGFFYIEKDPVKKEELKNDFFNNALPAWLKATEAIIAGNCCTNSGFIVGDKLTWADIAVFDVLDVLLQFQSGVLEGYPKVSHVFEQVKSQPKIAEWLATRPETPF